MVRHSIFLFVVLYILFVACGCGEDSKQTSLYFPDTLPSELSVKKTLSKDENLKKLQLVSKSKGVSPEEWKEMEKNKIDDSQINRYYAMERTGSSGFETSIDMIDSKREGIRRRLAWARIFKNANISVSQDEASYLPLSKINLQNSITIGNRNNAKWTIVEWSDFNCSFCRKSHPASSAIRKKYGKDIFWIRKDYPLESDTREGLLALSVMRCVHFERPELYWQSLDSIYELKRFSIHTLEEKLEAGSLPQNTIKLCTSEESIARFEKVVQMDHSEAVSLGVGSIPTILVNGRFVVGALDLISFEKILKATFP
ncbi:DsbA family protein [Leptospira sp. 'Mane']|uniref:DsbA family protein n=1 Tax=Leptospira sp. 'Mane' TaxID=3387407 RepID=UPI00398B2EFE